VLPLAVLPARLLLILLLIIATYGFLKDTSGIPSSWMPNDKVMHVLVFLALTLSYLQAFAGRRVIGVVALALYGALIEVAQATFTNRMGDPLDWLADLAGIGLGLLLLRLWPACFPHTRQEFANGR